MINLGWGVTKIENGFAFDEFGRRLTIYQQEEWSLLSSTLKASTM